MLEFFGTWNIKDKVYLTPLVKYSSYAKVNYGLAAGLKLHESFQIQIGSGYLNSMIGNGGLLGSGGFIRLIYIN